MDPLLLPLNKNVDNAVHEFAEAIAKIANEANPAANIVVDYDDAIKKDHTERSSIATIFSDHGVITVFPDFNNNIALAAIMNRGMVQAMLAEGFSEKEISAEKIYSSTLPYSEDNARMFAAVLAVDMGFQHQKRLTPIQDNDSKFSDL